MKLKSGYNQVETGSSHLTPSSASLHFISELEDLYQINISSLSTAVPSGQMTWSDPPLSPEPDQTDGQLIVVNIDVNVPSPSSCPLLRPDRESYVS